MILVNISVLAASLVVLAGILTAICRDSSHFHGLDKGLDVSLPGAFFQRLYFVMTTLTTIGYGDIAPRSVRAKSFIMLTIFIIVVVILKTLDNFATFVKESIVSRIVSIMPKRTAPAPAQQQQPPPNTEKDPSYV
jgi:hypothetical protein